MSTPIIYIHQGKIPRYLRANLLNSRGTNPDSPIFLIGDVDLPAALKAQMGVQFIHKQTLENERLQQFRDAYVHLSRIDLRYERFCFERWFYIAHFLKSRGLNEAICPDSDCLLFGRAERILEFCRDAGKAYGICGDPYFAIVFDGCETLTNFIIHYFSGSDYLANFRREMEKAASEGGELNLTDMTIFDKLLVDGMNKQTTEGWLDVNINTKQDFKMGYRWRALKKTPIKAVTFQIKDGLALPYGEKIDGSVVPFASLHFQSGSKRLIRAFNSPVQKPTPSKLWWWNHFVFKK
jgi:hypothetical protein